MKKVALIILDGWGHGKKDNSNAIFKANTPVIDNLYENSINTELITHGLDVGLPDNQMGNSEVGHMNIGAGRIVYQDLAKINNDIFDNKLDLQDINIIGSGKITKYEGTINFSKNRFYEIQVNLFERMKMKPPGFFSTDILTSKNYQIKQKIKLGKINYIDRDNFGMIIRVKKVKNS